MRNVIFSVETREPHVPIQIIGFVHINDDGSSVGIYSVCATYI